MPAKNPWLRKFNPSIEMRWMVVAGLIVIAAILALWRPWQERGETRSVTVTGQTTLRAVPDEYVFSPTFERTGAEQERLRETVSATVQEVIDDLMALGVGQEAIKLNVHGGDGNFYVYPSEKEGEYRVTANLTVTINDLELAQRIQEYLHTTSATGQLTPIAQFSLGKRQELDKEARELAIADARSKADQAASLLEAKLGKVLEVSESAGFDVYPLGRDAAEPSSADNGSTALPVLPGQNEFTYSLSVKFALR